MQHKTRLLLTGVVLAVGGLLSACSQVPATPVVDVPYLEELTQAVAEGSSEDILALVHFSPFPCTTAEGLGGPPKCLPSEPEGTPVEALPMLGPEGQHIRRSDSASWTGIGAAHLYAVIRTKPEAFPDEFYPTGDFGVAFLDPDGASVVVFQITDRGIVRLDYHPRVLFDEAIADAEVLLGPISPP